MIIIQRDGSDNWVSQYCFSFAIGKKLSSMSTKDAFNNLSFRISMDRAEEIQFKYKVKL